MEFLYGKTVITPNMHLHLHIRECVENYGSVYGFWLFSFERYNGLLGSFHTNNREVEVQLMRRFLTMSALDDLQYQMPLDFQELFYSICSEVRQTNLGRGNDQVVVVVESHGHPVSAKLQYLDGFQHD